MNGNGISTELSRVIVNGPGSVTRVTVTNLNEAGTHQCTVSNDRVTDGNNGSIGGVQALSSTTSLSLSGLYEYSLLIIIFLYFQYLILQLVLMLQD